ncbi:hypothetical protein EFO78_06335 [Lacticaseibacillus rhamnosus]|nr:hypothetical protein [Lacticaseibacillus rhamnosus]
MALDVMAGLWPLRPRSLCAGFWLCERVSESKPQSARQSKTAPEIKFISGTDLPYITSCQLAGALNILQLTSMRIGCINRTAA